MLNYFFINDFRLENPSARLRERHRIVVASDGHVFWFRNLNFWYGNPATDGYNSYGFRVVSLKRKVNFEGQNGGL